ncbi:MAG: FAD-dependent oxidoreductase [Acidobacteriia bacterium]|nr:FAD-dependent oxidoreductase [Terriglobia bacterium]
MALQKSYDVAVIGAGVFGAWTASHLARRGHRILLLDSYSPGHSRASSGGESRIHRMAYGADEIYTHWSLRSLHQWRELFAGKNLPLFRQTGVLWLAGEDTTQLLRTQETLRRCSVNFLHLDRPALERLYPHFVFDNVGAGLLEPAGGVLLARRALVATVQDAIARGVEFRHAAVVAPRSSGRLSSLSTLAGEKISADAYVFACGPWLGKLFPGILGPRIFPTRQEVFFFAPPPGDSRFAPPASPAWLFQDDQVYGIPDIESRGFKVALDWHGELIDPDTQSRTVTPAVADWVRSYIARRFPALAGAPLTETRVCQYENTSNGDFLIDRHPEIDNLWFAGGGSGHGFKHGPAFGEYLAAQLESNSNPEPRFSLSTKQIHQRRSIF